MISGLERPRPFDGRPDAHLHEDSKMVDTADKKLVFKDYPASRPGPITYAVIAGVIVLYIAVAHGSEVKALLGF